MRATLSQFILSLRSKDETARHKWLIILSAGSMLIVIGLWVQYVRSFVLIENTEAITQGTIVKPSFAAVFSTGLQVLSDKGRQTAETIRRRFQQEHRIVIKNPNRNFILEGLESPAPVSIPK